LVDYFYASSAREHVLDARFTFDGRLHESPQEILAPHRHARFNVAEWSLSTSTFDEIAADIDDARVHGGIHFRFDQAAGARQGLRVGDYVYLRPARSRRRARKPTSAGARALAESREAPLEAYSAPSGPQRLERRRLDLERLHVKRLQARGRGGRFSVASRIRSDDRVRIVRAIQTGRVTHCARRGGSRHERAHVIGKSGSGNQDSERYCDGYLFHLPVLNIASPQY
jgi:hypothetical protein